MIFTVLRLVNVALAVLIVLVMFARVQSWRALPTQHRFYGTGLFALVVVTGYAAVETVLVGVPGGARVVFYTVALTFLAIASFIRTNPKEPHREP